MATQNSTTLKFLTLLIVFLAYEARDTVAFFGRVSVTIIDDMKVGNTSKNITFHCKSKDDDLGFHTLNFGGRYLFTFRPQVFGATLFFCSFTWQGGSYPHYFDIYDFQRDDCKYCLWKINKFGACKYRTETQLFDVCLPWHKRSGDDTSPSPSPSPSPM
jgi:hypothetical protein